MNNQIRLAIIAIAIVIPLSSFTIWVSTYTPSQNYEGNTKLQVISSFYPLYEFAQKVGKDEVQVKLLVPLGVEPHDWEPTIQDVQLMQKSDLIIINGIGFENWLDDLYEINYQGTIVDTSHGIFIDINESEQDPNHDEHDHTLGDPHIWLNPVLAKTQVQNIANAFSNADPKNVKYYQQNAANYISELDALDLKIRSELSGCNRDFIAFHDAFSYFADEYGLHQHTIISSTEPHAEPTAKTLEDVINKARELNISVIFTEETADPRTSKVISDEIGGKVLILSPLEIVSDGDYISKMTENLDNLKEALC